MPYIKTQWVPGRTEVTAAFMNKIEDQLEANELKINAIIATPAEGVSAQEIIDARQGEINLGANITVIKSLLAEKATQTDVDTLLLTKRDKGVLISQNDVTDELKQQILGTTPLNAVPANGSLIKERFKPSVISPMLTDFVSVGKNLFNKSTAIDGYLIMGTGVLTASASYYLSDYIAVLPNTVYGRSYSTTANYYDSQYNFISQSVRAKTYTTPANCVFVRLNGDVGKKDIDQFELGVTSTYEPFKIILNDLGVSYDDFDSSLKNTFEELSSIIRPSKNLFNKINATLNRWLNSATGALLPETVSGRFTSDFIDISQNAYTLSPKGSAMTIVFYNATKAFLSSVTDSTVVTPPVNAVYLRFSSFTDLLDETQVEVGTEVTTYSSFGNKVTPEAGEAISQSNVQTSGIIYTFNDAWVEWLRGNKFPIAFFGNSTVDGYGTTGFVGNTVGVDSTSPNAFPKKLEELLRVSTNNNVLRIYNAGFSGDIINGSTTSLNAKFAGTSAYADTKMIGIGFGINDRLGFADEKEYRDVFKTKVKQVITWCYDNNIQPFLVTTQATLEPGVKTEFASEYPMRTSGHIETIANEVKRELAKEFGLELLDMNKFTEMFLIYSSYPTKVIIPDQLHFADVGHKYEAELLFSKICPRTNIIDSHTQIDYSTQKLQDSIPQDWLTMPDAPTDSFKVYVDHIKPDSTDMKIMTVWVFVDSKKKLTLKAYRNTSATAYIKVNGTSTILNTAETVLGQLDLGLYKLEVFTGASIKADFKGFIITEQ